jgi:putative tryptophan/tyrosine transport system substrate-binding protein
MKKNSGLIAQHSALCWGEAMRTILCLSLTIAMWVVATVDAQQPTKIPRIGYLTGATPDGQSARIQAFRQGMRELGYMEGKNLLLSIDMQS